MRRRSSLLVLLVGLGGCGPAPGAEPEEPVHLTETVVLPAPPRSEEIATTQRGPFEPGQRWRGIYLCPQGETDLTLVVDEVVGVRVKAIFEFSHEGSGARGSFFLDGLYDATTRRVRFSPRQWIVRPGSYITVGMDGTVSPDGTTVTGKITNETCGRFDLELVRTR